MNQDLSQALANAALVQAIVRRDVHALRDALEKGADANFEFPDEDGGVFPPLAHVFMDVDRDDTSSTDIMMQALVSGGADVNFVFDCVGEPSLVEEVFIGSHFFIKITCV